MHYYVTRPTQRLSVVHSNHYTADKMVTWRFNNPTRSSLGFVLVSDL
jgi:hypothetical protein